MCIQYKARRLFFSLVCCINSSWLWWVGADSPDLIPAPQISFPTPTVLQGVLVDSAVDGLAYTTVTQSGMTNVKGQFSYIACEEVVFSIGDIQFPAVVGQEMISPLDVF